jgi:hypothetical protein
VAVKAIAGSGDCRHTSAAAPPRRGEEAPEAVTPAPWPRCTTSGSGLDEEPGGSF